MTAGDPCGVPGCESTDTRFYMCGQRCDPHSPWAVAGHPDPQTQVDPTRGASALRVAPTPLHAKGGVEVDKAKPGGYVSRQRAQRIAAERDAARAANVDRSDFPVKGKTGRVAAIAIIEAAARRLQFVSSNEVRAEMDAAGIDPASRGGAWAEAARTDLIEYVGHVRSTDPGTKGHDIREYRSLIYTPDRVNV